MRSASSLTSVFSSAQRATLPMKQAAAPHFSPSLDRRCLRRQSIFLAVISYSLVPRLSEQPLSLRVWIRTCRSSWYGTASTRLHARFCLGLMLAHSKWFCDRYSKSLKVIWSRDDPPVSVESIKSIRVSSFCLPK